MSRLYESLNDWIKLYRIIITVGLKVIPICELWTKEAITQSCSPSQNISVCLWYVILERTTNNIQGKEILGLETTPICFQQWNRFHCVEESHVWIASISTRLMRCFWTDWLPFCNAHTHICSWMWKELTGIWVYWLLLVLWLFLSFNRGK